MDLTPSFVLVTFLLTLLIHLLVSISSSRRRTPRNLPPGPYPFPIIGNILQLGRNPHISLTSLSENYGPLIHLKLGTITTIVVSSPEIARKILTEHNNAFPTRMTTAAIRALDHHTASVACLPAGNSLWRTLRRICREQLFSARRLEAGRALRQEKLRKLADYVRGCCSDGRAVDIGEAAFATTLNLMSNTLFSVDFSEYETGSCKEFAEIIRGLMMAFGRPNLADYFPVLGRFFDPQGIERESELYMGRLFEMFDGIIDERLESTVKKNDLLEALLEISGGDQSELSRNDMKHLLLDLFVAGTDTTSGTVEWVMTELLRNPNIMSRAKEEIQTIIGQNKSIEESDITNLSYLQAVIKETFRHHPPGPFLFRTCDQDNIEIGNFNIPKNAIIFINIWAMSKDSSTWTNPDSFEPERFLNGEIDVKGHNFELIPFGAGKRMCPGLPLAHRMVHLMVASLLRDFDWELEHGLRPEELDMNEKFGLSLQKVVPLRAVPINLT